MVNDVRLIFIQDLEEYWKTWKEDVNEEVTSQHNQLIFPRLYFQAFKEILVLRSFKSEKLQENINWENKYYISANVNQGPCSSFLHTHKVDTCSSLNIRVHFLLISLQHYLEALLPKHERWKIEVLIQEDMSNFSQSIT